MIYDKPSQKQYGTRDAAYQKRAELENVRAYELGKQAQLHLWLSCRLLCQYWNMNTGVQSQWR
jgi:hypothetical protein